MAFPEPVWGPVQRRIMVFVYRRRLATLDEIAVQLARPTVDRSRSKRSIDYLIPKYLIRLDDGFYECTPLGSTVAANVFNAAKDFELCRSIQYDAGNAN